MRQMSRMRKILRFWYLPPAAFYAMEAAHESGHALAGWLSGGKVRRVLLLPWELSGTEFTCNPHPLFTAWGGFAGGVCLPLLLWLLLCRWKSAHLLRFFAGFCLVSNGVYLCAGAFFRAGDCRELLMYGTPFLLLPLVGGAMAVAGFLLWNGQGGKFSLREKTPPGSDQNGLR